MGVYSDNIRSRSTLFINIGERMSISVKTALKMIAQNANNPKFKVIDVRTPAERAASFIPNSTHIPLAEL